MLKSPNAFYQDCRFTLYSQAEDKKILKRSDFNSDILYGYTALQQSDFRWLLILCLHDRTNENRCLYGTSHDCLHMY